jgi:hypothetical protein
VRRFPISIAGAGISALLMIVGGFGPWAKVLGVITIDGTDDGKDGWIVVAAAGVAIALLVVLAFTRRRWLALIPLLAGVVAAATTGYDISDISSVGGGRLASAEWGIYLSLIASIGLALASLAAIFELRRPRAGSDAFAVLPPTAETDDRPDEERQAAAQRRDAHDREHPAAQPEA